MTKTSLQLPLIILTLLLGVSGCGGKPEPAAEPEITPEKKTAKPEKDPFADFRVEEALDEVLDQPGFLETDYEPLSNWMSERFEVKYRAMTPELIFDQVPLNDIHYELRDLPEDGTKLEFSSLNVSRRELLQKVAETWNLKLSYQAGPDGNPAAVIVEPK